MKKFALITGASRGLGEALAHRFWAAGFSICLVSRKKEDVEKVTCTLPNKEGQQVICLASDLSKPESVSDLILNVRRQLPRLDVLVNNAAIHGPVGPLWENDFLLWHQTIQVDLLAAVSLCRAFIPWMGVSGGGTIINISGGGATGPRANFSAYATAKAGLVRFSETLAKETESLGVRVNCIAPGAMKTALLAEVLQRGADIAGEREFAIAQKVFDGEGASMDRVADLILFLASEAGKDITGKLISAVWDDWERWPEHLDDLCSGDVYTLRRITGRDRGFTWGDK